jgi:hypothetical protein
MVLHPTPDPAPAPAPAPTPAPETMYLVTRLLEMDKYDSKRYCAPSWRNWVPSKLLPGHHNLFRHWGVVVRGMLYELPGELLIPNVELLESAKKKHTWSEMQPAGTTTLTDRELRDIGTCGLLNPECNTMLTVGRIGAYILMGWNMPRAPFRLWNPRGYDFLRHNCQDFAVDFCNLASDVQKFTRQHESAKYPTRSGKLYYTFVASVELLAVAVFLLLLNHFVAPSRFVWWIILLVLVLVWAYKRLVEAVFWAIRDFRVRSDTDNGRMVFFPNIVDRPELNMELLTAAHLHHLMRKGVIEDSDGDVADHGSFATVGSTLAT